MIELIIAFFGEFRYFTSRPEIFAAGAQRSGQGSHEHADPVQEATAQVASTMKRAMVNNPEATAKVFGAGLRHAASAASSTPPSKRAFAPSAAASAQSTSANSNQEVCQFDEDDDGFITRSVRCNGSDTDGRTRNRCRPLLPIG